MPANTGDKRTDTATRVIDAPAETLYDAYMDPAKLVRWLPPGDMTARIDAFEARAGGRFDMTLSYVQAGHGNRGKSSEESDVVHAVFLELVPGRRIVQAVRFDSDDPAFAGEMIMTWSFDPLGAATKVTILCDNVPHGIGKADHDMGLNASLANLAAFAGDGRSQEDQKN